MFNQIFAECLMVREAWGWVRMRLLNLLSRESARCSNFEVLTLMFEKDLMDMEAVWLIVTYVEYVWTEKFLHNKLVKLEQLVIYVIDQINSLRNQYLGI